MQCIQAGLEDEVVARHEQTIAKISDSKSLEYKS